jgi:hypothetical protein
MGTYLVGYDLDKPGQDYADLIAAIKNLGAWWHHLDSTWLVVCDLDHKQIRDHLKAYMDVNDKLLVINVSNDTAAWYGFTDKGSQWLKDNL